MKRIRNMCKIEILKKIIVMILVAMLLSQTIPMQYVMAETNPESLQEQDTNTLLRAAPIPIDASTFPDENFRNYLLNDLLLVELDSTTITNTTKLEMNNKGIKDLSGIEYFTNLEILYCEQNLLENITLQNPKMIGLFCGDNPSLTTLNIEALTELDWLDCGSSAIEKLDLSKNTKLQKIYCNTMKLKELDVSHNNNLDYFVFSDNQIEKLVIGQQNKLVGIYGDNNLLTDIDITNYPSLVDLELPGNLIGSIDTSRNPILESLYVKENQLVSLDVTNNPNMSNHPLDFTILNQKAKTVGVDNIGTIDMSLYDSNFDGTRVSNLSIGIIDGNKIINAPLSGQITYKYYIGKVKGSAQYLDVTLQLELDTFEINYVLDSGTNNTSNPTTYKTSGPTITLNDPTKTGYSFDGWYDQATGGNKITTIAKGSTGNKTLYARWKPTDYSIIYNNLFEASSTNPDSYTIETSSITLSNPTSRTGYTFDGWYDQVTGGNKVTTIAKGSTGNKVLYARWRGINYSITYNNLFGTSSMNPDSYTVDNTIALTSPSHRSGYSFDGWYDQATGGNKITTIAKGSTGSKVLYAQWKKTFYESQEANGSITFVEGQDELWQLHITQESIEVYNDINNLVSLYDIYYSLSGVRLPVQNLNMTVSLNLKKEDQGYTNYKIVHLDEYGIVQEEFIPTLINNGTAIQFETTHLSYYGIIAWNDPSSSTSSGSTSSSYKNTTVVTGDRNTFYIDIYTLLISSIIFIYTMTKRKNLKNNK